MGCSSGDKTVVELRGRIAALREELREALDQVTPEPVEDYTFQSASGEVRLSGLFGERDELFVVHNMGRSCMYCTLWVDGFNGIADHLQSRAAFIVASPDDPQTQKEFADGRGWRLPLVSHSGSSFAADMGYQHDEWGYLPGVSVFTRKAGQITRVADTPFGPGDDFCSIWHLFDMLPGGKDDWEPKYDY